MNVQILPPSSGTRAKPGSRPDCSPRAAAVTAHAPAAQETRRDAVGRAHRTWYLTGPEQFPHAGTDAGFSRRNDGIARAVLRYATGAPQA